jgi:hypothetical protein
VFFKVRGQKLKLWCLKVRAPGSYDICEFVHSDERKILLFYKVRVKVIVFVNKILLAESIGAWTIKFCTYAPHVQDVFFFPSKSDVKIIVSLSRKTLTAVTM